MVHRDLNPTVLIPQSIKKVFLIEADKWYPKETGGVLIGYWKDQQHVYITNMVGPGPSAQHTECSFIPDDEYQINEIAKFYLESNTEKTYLGDWHTHPKATAYLSRIDKRTLKKIARYKLARLINPLMLVIGFEKGINIKVWYADILNTSTILQAGVQIVAE